MQLFRLIFLSDIWNSSTKEDNMKVKKVMAATLTLAMTAGLLAGCGSGGAEGGSSSSGKTEITIYQSKIEANEGYQKAIDTYEKKSILM